MQLKLPHFANTVLFRISAIFLLLVSIGLGGYYYWIEKTVFNPYASPAEQNWYEELAASQLDSLADDLSGVGLDPAANGRLTAYGEITTPYGADVIAFAADGSYLWSTQPDSLGAALPRVDAGLLRRMSEPDWDFSSYPDSVDAEAFINRIFEIRKLPDAQSGAAGGFLVASFRPTRIQSEDLNADSRLISAQENIFKVIMGLLIYSALTALLIMLWTGRRIQRLAAGVDAFAAGDLSHRVETRSTDEIGTLGRNFNAMAGQIESMVADLRKKEQFHRQLVANVSHDLRTPMASLRGYVETLQMIADEDPRNRQRYLRIIAGNIDHLERLVEHTMILSRFDSGQAVFRMEVFSIAELMDDVLIRLQGVADAQQVSLDLKIGPAVELVSGDPLQIGQVVQNLIENGIKFNRPGGSVTVTAERDDQDIVVAVSDTGRGIPAPDLPHIFDRFFTGDASRTRHMADPESDHPAGTLVQGSGLGLSIASKIVAAHDSVLRVASTPGSGTVFTFRLARVADPDQELVGEA